MLCILPFFSSVCSFVSLFLIAINIINSTEPVLLARSHHHHHHLHLRCACEYRSHCCTAHWIHLFPLFFYRNKKNRKFSETQKSSYNLGLKLWILSIWLKDWVVFLMKCLCFRLLVGIGWNRIKMTLDQFLWCTQWFAQVLPSLSSSFTSLALIYTLFVRFSTWSYNETFLSNSIGFNEHWTCIEHRYSWSNQWNFFLYKWAENRFYWWTFFWWARLKPQTLHLVPIYVKSIKLC